MQAKSLVPFATLALAGALSATGCKHATPATPDQPAPQPAPGYVAPLVAPVAIPGMDVAGLVERLRPTVVNITTTSRATGEHPFERMMPFRHPRSDKQRSLGTGFIVDPAGYVVTNTHVVAGAEDIKVRLADDRELPAKVVGKDPKLDLAVLKIDGASDLSAVVLGDSDGLRVGEWVIAIGNPYGLGHTVTLGITSAKGRTIGAGPYDAFIQTDASINPGNSGGPLFNLKGEVVGIPTAIRPGAQGIGFAVPVNALKDVLPQLRERGVVSRGKLGVRIQPMTEELAKGFGLDRPRGALIAAVEPDGAGAKAGLRAGDVILQVAGQPVARSEDLPRLVARNPPGTLVKLSFLREGKEQAIEAKLDQLVDQPDDDDEAPPPPKDPAKSPPAGPAGQGRLGVEIEDVAGGGGGVRVVRVAPGSAAAGQIAAGDLVTEVNRTPVKSAEDAAKRMEAVGPGKVLVLTLRRGTDQRFVALKVK